MSNQGPPQDFLRSRMRALRARVPSRRSLQGRIVASVGAALLLILGLFVVVALWALRQGTEEAFQTRIVHAQAYAARVDDAVDYVSRVLDEAASTLVLESDELTTAQMLQLVGVRRRIGPATSLAAIRADGRVLWADCVEPCSPEEVEREAGRSTTPFDPPPHLVTVEHGEGAELNARIMAPVRDPSGRRVATLLADLHPGHPGLMLFSDAEAPQGFDMDLISLDGRLIAGSRLAARRSQQTMRGSAREHAALIVSLTQSHQGGYRVHPTAPGRLMPDHVVAYAPLSSIPSWVVTVEQGFDEALALPVKVQGYFALIGGLVLAVVMALAFFDVRRITAPIDRLTASARRLAEGNLDEPVLSDGPDEVGELARTFELMRLRLRDFMARERTIAVIEERERIASEMHDGLGQVLGYVIMKSLALERLLENGNTAEARTQVGQLEAAARGAYADVRESILALRTTLAPDRSLLVVLQEYIAGFERQNDLLVEFTAPPETPGGWIDPAAEIQILRIVQEALTNVRKHAQATQVSVSLVLRENQLTLDIVDDGSGFTMSAAEVAEGAHFGLRIMCERAEGVGGTFSVGPGATGGTHVQVTLPRRKGAVHGAPTHPPGG